MLFSFTTPVLIRHLWQLKTVVFLHWCLICVVLLYSYAMLSLEHSIIFSATTDTHISSSLCRQLGPNGQSIMPMSISSSFVEENVPWSENDTSSRLVNPPKKLLYCRSKLSSRKRKIFNIRKVS